MALNPNSRLGDLVVTWLMQTWTEDLEELRIYLNEIGSSIPDTQGLGEEVPQIEDAEVIESER